MTPAELLIIALLFAILLCQFLLIFRTNDWPKVWLAIWPMKNTCELLLRHNPLPTNERASFLLARRQEEPTLADTDPKKREALMFYDWRIRLRTLHDQVREHGLLIMKPTLDGILQGLIDRTSPALIPFPGFGIREAMAQDILHILNIKDAVDYKERDYLAMANLYINHGNRYFNAEGDPYDEEEEQEQEQDEEEQGGGREEDEEEEGGNGEEDEVNSVCNLIAKRLESVQRGRKIAVMNRIKQTMGFSMGEESSDVSFSFADFIEAVRRHLNENEAHPRILIDQIFHEAEQAGELPTTR